MKVSLSLEEMFGCQTNITLVADSCYSIDLQRSPDALPLDEPPNLYYMTLALKQTTYSIVRVFDRNDRKRFNSSYHNLDINSFSFMVCVQIEIEGILRSFWVRSIRLFALYLSVDDGQLSSKVNPWSTPWRLYRRLLITLSLTKPRKGWT